ncbi:MAG: FHA domain-containing protein [Fuerstiella sp.]|nr:FHA domain-containing protein [Fuerstiella sp.]
MAISPSRKFMLWIDGVGAWQLCVGESFVVGAPSFEEKSADIALLADISRKHASIERNGEEWRLTAHQSTAVSGRTVSQDTVLCSGDEIQLAERVRLGFRIPSILSTSAIINFESDHRPSHSVDGIILLADHCLLGPRKDHHVCCTQWSDVVVLFAGDGMLRCRSKVALSVNGQVANDSIELKHGCVVTGEELRFRVEQME